MHIVRAKKCQFYIVLSQEETHALLRKVFYTVGLVAPIDIHCVLLQCNIRSGASATAHTAAIKSFLKKIL